MFKKREETYQSKSILGMFLKSLTSFWLTYEIANNKYSPSSRCEAIPAASGAQSTKFRKTNHLKSIRLAILQPQWPLQMRPCQPPADRHMVSSISPWALLPPEFQVQDPCEGSSPYFCWRTDVVFSRALRRKWRTVKRV